MKQSHDSAELLAAEIDWLTALIAKRLEAHAEGRNAGNNLQDIPPPSIEGDEGSYAAYLARNECSSHDRVALILALAPTIAPYALDPFLIINQAINRRFTEFGGRIDAETGAFTPTLQTAVFILAGNEVTRVVETLAELKASRLHGQNEAFLPDSGLQDDLALQQRLVLTQEARELLLWGNEYSPPFSSEFPAEQLHTDFEWSDLILQEEIREEVEQIATWLEHQDALMNDWELSKRLAAGYRSLFAGPPGTGKTLTATLLGKRTDRPVFRVDLSKIVSKYIGETEKNLARLFDRAQHHDWILFFDEADSLFARRGDANTAGDRAANQNVSYLLQRIESFEGTIILASNLPDNIDDAFARRFQSIVNFRMPGREERLKLWTDSFVSKPFAVSADIDWHVIARDYDVSGGQIINILRYCCMKAIERDRKEISQHDLVQGIRREFLKAGQGM